MNVKRGCLRVVVVMWVVLLGRDSRKMVFYWGISYEWEVGVVFCEGDVMVWFFINIMKLMVGVLLMEGDSGYFVVLMKEDKFFLLRIWF